MTSKMLFIGRNHLWIAIFIFSVSFTWAEDVKQWPADISSKDRIHVYKKLTPALKDLRSKKQKVSVGTFRGKLYRGDVVKVGKTKFTVVDYKGKRHTIKFKEIKASYLDKIIPSKQQDGKVLHCLGLISLQEGKTKNAKAYLQRAVKAKNSDSQQYLSQVQDNLNSTRQEQLASKERQIELERKKREVAKAEKTRIRQEKARAKIANIVSLDSKELDVKANSFPGKYTIFKFGAPW